MADHCVVLKANGRVSSAAVANPVRLEYVRYWPLVIIRSTSLTKVVGRVVWLISQYSMPSCIFPSRFQRDENNQGTD